MENGKSFESYLACLNPSYFGPQKLDKSLLSKSNQ
jgi:hypothetical protein